MHSKLLKKFIQSMVSLEHLLTFDSQFLCIYIDLTYELSDQSYEITWDLLNFIVKSIVSANGGGVGGEAILLSCAVI